MKIIKILFLCLGFYILYVTIRAVGIENIKSRIADLNWKLLPLLFIYPFVFAFDTLGWSFAFPKSLPKHIPFKSLYVIRIVGETLNAVIPWAASLGGEPVKAELLKSKHRIPLADGYASILIVHTTFWISLNLFVLGGILFTFKTLPLTRILWHSVLAFLFGLGIVAASLIMGLHLGIFQKVHHLGERFKWWGEKSHEKRERFLDLDRQIKKFYTKNPKHFFFSVLFNFLGWFTGTFEVYFIGKALGMPIGLSEAWLLEALTQVLRIMTFFIPSSIGAQEGGIVLIFMQFGFNQSLGFTFALIRRIREMIWIAIGLTLWAMIEDKPVIAKKPSR